METGNGPLSGHGGFDRIDLQEIQELLCRMGAVISFRRNDAEVAVELDILKRRDFKCTMLNRLACRPD